MEANAVLTEHMVDNIPPQLYAISEFMNYSMFSFMNSTFSADSRSMKYQVRNYDQVPAYLKRARFIIAVFHLPLEAEMQHEVGSHGIRSFLHIKYIGAAK